MSKVEEDTFFRLYSACIPVAGKNEGQLFDLQRKGSYEIPKLLVEVLQELETKSIGAVKAHYNNHYDEGIDAYLNELEAFELGFFTTTPEAFPKLSMVWDSPLKIQTAILEIDTSSTYDVKDLLIQLNGLGCSGVQIRFFKEVDLEELDHLLSDTKTSRLSSIELYTIDKGHSLQALDDFLKKHLRISYWIHYSGEEDSRLEFGVKALKNKVFRTRQQIEKGTKDIFNLSNFPLDLRLFSEAHHFNVALNRKVGIDVNGNIKNHPAHQQVFGNVSTHQIAEVIASDAFQLKWKIPNDQIEKCKDCQFRYVCFFNSDVEQINGKWVKVDDCGVEIKSPLQ